MNLGLLLMGGLIGIIFIICFFVNNTIYSNNQNLINHIDKNIVDCSENKKCSHLKSDQLIYYTGIYYGDNAFDENFNMEFKEPIRIRSVDECSVRSVKEGGEWKSKKFFKNKFS
jgi:hypothetical protein